MRFREGVKVGRGLDTYRAARGGRFGFRFPAGWGPLLGPLGLFPLARARFLPLPRAARAHSRRKDAARPLIRGSEGRNGHCVPAEGRARCSFCPPHDTLPTWSSIVSIGCLCWSPLRAARCSALPFRIVSGRSAADGTALGCGRTMLPPPRTVGVRRSPATRVRWPGTISATRVRWPRRSLTLRVLSLVS